MVLDLSQALPNHENTRILSKSSECLYFVAWKGVSQGDPEICVEMGRHIGSLSVVLTIELVPQMEPDDFSSLVSWTCCPPSTYIPNDDLVFLWQSQVFTSDPDKSRLDLIAQYIDIFPDIYFPHGMTFNQSGCLIVWQWALPSPRSSC